MILKETKSKGLIAEPNYRMAHDILTPIFEQTLKEFHIDYTFSASENMFKTEYGDVIVRTLEKRTALEGHNLGWFYVDEFDLMSESDANDAWRVLISKLTLGEIQRGFGTGTNEGYNFIYKKFALNCDVEQVGDYSPITNTYYERSIYSKPNHKLFISPIFENEDNLPNDYIDTLMSNYDTKLIERYLLGKFVNIQTGKVYYSFNTNNITDVEFSPYADTYLSWDINYSDRMMSTSLIQRFSSEGFELADPTKDVYVVTKFFGNKDTNTETQCKIILEFLQENNFSGTLKEYGDRVGLDRRTNAPVTHYSTTSQYFGEYAGYSQNFKPTKSIADRVASVNRLLCNSLGNRQLYINKNQTLLIEDLEQVAWKSNSKDLDNSNINRTDATDSLSYYCYYEHDIVRNEMTWN